MADTTARANSSIIDHLLSQGHEFSLVQAMRIARSRVGCAVRGASGLHGHEGFRVRPDLSLAFPASDVARVEPAEDPADLRITANFLGLYGSSSPLPTHYSEDLLEEVSADSCAGRDFVDLLHRRLYELYFRCWSKYRLPIKVAEEHDPRDLERLYCLIGLGDEELCDSVPDAYSLLRYAGLLTQFSRSAEGLQALLRDASGVDRLVVEQCVLRRAQIAEDQQLRLGVAGSLLGGDKVLGTEKPDLSGKIRIHIGPLPRGEYGSFLPGTERHRRLARLVRFYLSDPLECDLRLIVEEGEAGPPRLGDPARALLGWNSWLSADEPGVEASAVVAFECGEVQKPEGAQRERIEPKGRVPTLVEYYQDELTRLRDLAAIYAEAHPKLASLVSPHDSDPGVERLLEGVALLNACLREKLDDDVPEVINEVAARVHPWNLRPIPASTVVAFTPGPELLGPLLLGAGAEVASVPVQGTRCTFTTCFDVKVYPLSLLDAVLVEEPGQGARIALHLEVFGDVVSGWEPEVLRFFLADEYAAACDLYLLMMRYLKRIVVTSDGDKPGIELPPGSVQPAGVAASETVLDRENASLPGHVLLQEYFLFRDKFLFFDLCGLGACDLRGCSRLEISFELGAAPFKAPEVTGKSFLLYATPAINLFERKGKLVGDSGHGGPQRIVPEGKEGHFEIYSLDGVQEPGPGVYQASADINLTCTNGDLPRSLGVGDICIPTSTVPETLRLENIKEVAVSARAESGDNLQWKLLSTGQLTLATLLRAASFRAVLKDCSPRDRHSRETHLKTISAVEAIEVKPADRLIAVTLYRGYEVLMHLCEEGFAGLGDLYLFCCVVDRFLPDFVTDGSFVSLTVKVVDQEKEFQWPARLGNRKGHDRGRCGLP